MSLINDALKRAKQSQGPTTPPPGQHLHFRPVEPEPTARHGLGLLLPVALAFIALLALFFVWELAHSHGSDNRQTELVARAASTTPPSPAPPANPPPPVISEPPPAPPTPSEPEPAPSVSTPDPTEAASAAPAPAIPDAPPAAPKPPPLRLQGIIFNPSHPSAVINGKTLFIGDKVGEFRVGNITQDSATLVNAGVTNVLNLGE